MLWMKNMENINPLKPNLVEMIFKHSVLTYLKEDTTHNHYKDQLVNAVKGNNRCLLWESYETDK
jgi:hypothetical protein